MKQTISITVPKVVVSRSYLKDEKIRDGKERKPTGEKNLVLVYTTSTGFGESKQIKENEIVLKMSSVDYPKHLKIEELPDIFLGAIIESSRKIEINFPEK